MGKQQDDNFLDFDLNNLEEELERIPKVLKEYTRKLADAQEELDVAKDNLKLLHAEITLHVLEDPKHYGFAKAPAEKVREALVLTDDEYKKQQRKVSKAQHEVHILAGIVKSIEGANNNLRKECDLFAVGYWAPKMSKRGREASEEWGRAIHKQITERTRLKRGEEE